MAAKIESKNMHYAFNREYLDWALTGVDDNEVPEFNTSLLDVINGKDACAKIKSFGKKKCDELKAYGAKRFCVKVLYPGLLVGTGYPHETGNMKGEIQVGALFDYVSGAPYYPGSSVKGVLRDVFKRANESSPEAEEYRKYLLGLFPKEFKGNRLSDFEKETFDGIDPESKQPKRIGERDIFFDAYIIGTVNAGGDILKMDNLAPHKNQPTKEPIPINMIRIAPGACLQFNMKLTDSDLGVKADKKLEIFKEILLTLGFGAKRNVGYGAVEEISADSVIVQRTGNIVKQKGSAETKTGGSESKIKAEKLGVCPKCGNNIVNRSGKVYCEGNCGIVLNEYRHISISLGQLRALCQGKTSSFPGKKQIRLTKEGFMEV